MLAILSLAALYGGWRVVHAAIQAVRKLPRSNLDFIFF